jgi:hypothetical protein
VGKLGRKRGSVTLPLGVMALALFGAGQLFGAPGVTIVTVGSILWLAWRFDNETGAVFLLTVLFLLALVVPVLLLVLMAVTHS